MFTISLISGCDYFGNVDFEGRFRIDPIKDDDFVGFVFSYQNNTHFYLVDWKNKTLDVRSTPGVNIKVTVFGYTFCLVD